MLTGTRNMFRHSVPEKNTLRSRVRRKLLRGAMLSLALVTAKIRVAPGADSQQLLRQTLEQLAYRLFPHAGLSDRPYEELANVLAARASADSRFAQDLKLGIADLDGDDPTPWLERSETEQIAAIGRIEGSPFFRLMRQATIEHIYRNKEVWQLIGYEGSSVEFGGYVDRGFDDIDWLPGESDEQ